MLSVAKFLKRFSPDYLAFFYLGVWTAVPTGTMWPLYVALSLFFFDVVLGIFLIQKGEL